MVKVKSQLLNADAFSSYCVGGLKGNEIQFTFRNIFDFIHRVIGLYVFILVVLSLNCI